MGGCWCCDEDNSSDELLDDYSSPNRNWEPVIQQPRSTRSANNNRNGTNSTRGRNRRRSPAARRNRRRSSQRDTAWHTSQHLAPIHQSINHNSFASASNPNSNTNGSSPSEERHLIVSNLNSEPTWKISTLLHKEHNIGLNAAQQLETLFNEGNTIPFIARHRKDIIGQMTTEKLRNIKCTYNKLLQLRQDIAKVCADISAMGIMNEGLHSTLMNATSQVTLDEIHAPYKAVADQLASMEREELAIYEQSANLVLQGQSPFIEPTDTVQVMRHLAAKIGSCPASGEYLESLCMEANCTLRCDRIGDDDESPDREGHTFDLYYDRSFNTRDLREHQILAINRGEKLKYINVTLEFDDFSHLYRNRIRNYFPLASEGPFRNIFGQAIGFCYENIAVPRLKRMKRAALTDVAHQAALDVFTSNVKQLLLTTPVRNKRILGVDPGTSLGCKLGLISETGEDLATGVVFPKSKNQELEKRKFKRLLIKFSCSLIAIGNGKGCRDAEEWIADMISKDYFAPLRVAYTIVNESGVSIYSCSEEAIREFTQMHPTRISAISLARRVQDPLSELVKVEPQHLGIGMYQHDVNPEDLNRALAEVVTECVSFVGVDVNTASQCLLRYVAGLSDSLADEIILHRNRHGDFAQRKDIYDVRGVNTLTYKQCAGFLKIRNGVNKLDETCVHPESYEVVGRILQYMSMQPAQVGTDEFRAMLLEQRDALIRHNALHTSKDKLLCILDQLSKEEDVREIANCERWFRTDVKSMNDLSVGIELTGDVVNVTTFGSFIDVGVGTDGLLHVDNARGRTLRIGNRVKVSVCDLNVERGRIGLKLIAVQ
ncbi:S1 RNA-binding domain-containing protein 1-like [Atheta coriaria]|uniref:S1 RNA-binding domain-containing protein 1-like n=1 Tax=Dalotia coriaria TaxID=877792 RepID=UPI0031F4108C